MSTECEISCPAVRVDPDTVTFYTGLKDKNGKDIFEGDICRVSDTIRRKDMVGPVVYGPFEESHCDEYNCEHLGWHIACEYGGYCWNTGYALGLPRETAMAGIYGVEVIGNKFDNPELLEVKRREE